MFEITKSPAFQFLINPSTIFFISGMLVAKYREDSPKSSASDVSGLMNSTMPIWFKNGLDERHEGKKIANHSLLESYPIFDPMSALEMRLISLIIQGYDNTTKWQFKFVDLSSTSEKSYMYNEYLSSPAGHFQHKANVLITDSQERIPIWAVVNLNTMKVESWTKGKYEKGNADFITSSATGKLSEDEKIIAGEVALADAKVQKKIWELGYGNMDDVVPDVWNAGFISDYPKEKLAQIYFYGIREEDGVSYAYPCNFVAYVDLGKNIVREIESLPLYMNSKNIGNIKSISSAEPNSSFYSEKLLLPNTIRSEVYQLKGSLHQPPSFQISGKEELQR